MSAWPDRKLSPQMEEEASKHLQVILLHAQPHQKTDAVEGTLFCWTPPRTGFQYIRALFFFFFCVERGQHTAPAWGAVVQRPYSKFRSNLHSSVGDLGHVSGLAELFLCQQIGGKGDSLAQAHSARGGERGMAGELRKSTSFISFPSLEVKHSSMATSSPKPKRSGRFDSALCATRERR